jgi:hypothetical protein
MFVLVAAMAVLLAMVPGSAAASPPSGTQTGLAVQDMPASSHGCNGTVCIAVCNNASCTGSGTFIHHVSSTGITKALTGCAFGELLVRGQVRETSNVTCWDNKPGTLEELFDYFPVGYHINSGSQVCVQYKGRGAPSGKPCETVHS